MRRPAALRPAAKSPIKKAARATGRPQRFQGALNEAHRKIQLGDLSELIAIRLRYASGVANRAFAELFAPQGFFPRQYTAAYLIARNPGVNLRDLAQAIGLDPSTLIPTVDHLEAEGWIRRTRSPNDRRVVGLTITSRGRHEIARLEKAITACNEFLMSDLDGHERRTLFRLLDKIERAAAVRTA